eukprot:TRINITY_DN2922_c0_g1_i12.p2 TRINITY_DN2922_c0_g1~~TRINITY_DN2922_c0_g1_i12.p2  ORF type:complete len:245 (+),score=32.75 TRINITY_DN2922_c0_g1_i12:405-1139(+)
MSSVIPFLAWNPVFLLLVGVLFLDEYPPFAGVLGCLVVLLGAYLTSMDVKLKMKKKELDEDEATDIEDRRNLKNEHNLKNGNQNPTSQKDRGAIIAFFKSIVSYKAGLYMMGVALLWTYTSAVEKQTLKGHEYVPEAYLLGLQRVLMAVPSLAYCIYKRPKFLEHIYVSAPHLILAVVNESACVLLYFTAVQYVFVSYVIAIKRAGNIFISVVVGAVFYKEKLTRLSITSACLMILGVCLIVLG